MSIARLMQMARAGVPTGGSDVWTDPDLANASYDSVSFSVAGQELTPQGLSVSEDGGVVFIIGNTGDAVFQYTLSAAWDLSSASYVSSLSVASQSETNPQDLYVSLDGTQLYVIGTTLDSVLQYTLSTPWDLSSASYVRQKSISAQDGVPTGLYFKTDGLKMYVAGNNGDSVYEYDLSSAWDVSTASYVQAFSVATQETAPQAVSFNPDGSKMYIVGGVGQNVLEYDLSSSWDISTAAHNAVSFSFSSQDAGPRGVDFKSDGSVMYMIGLVGDAIYQYSTA